VVATFLLSVNTGDYNMKKRDPEECKFKILNILSWLETFASSKLL
jgi:hypothetical protein